MGGVCGGGEDVVKMVISWGRGKRVSGVKKKKTILFWNNNKYVSSSSGSSRIIHYYAWRSIV